MNNIKIVLADDHQLFREGLKSILEHQSDFEVVGEAIDGHTTLTMVNKYSPDIVLLDISMPGLNGIETLRRLTAEGSKTRVIILSMHSDRRFVSESFKAGARGYLLKDSALEELVTGIRTVMNGNVSLSSHIARVLVDDYVSLSVGTDSSSVSKLTSRELEVLQLIAEGHSTKETASRLNVSIKTIETHRKRIMDKLGLQGIAELTKYAIKEKIITAD